MTSYLDIFDLHTGSTTRVLETDRHIEAPNWAPDGTWLLVNGGGRLFRVPFDGPELQEIDTGFADRCNNDHGMRKNRNMSCGLSGGWGAPPAPRHPRAPRRAVTAAAAS